MNVGAHVSDGAYIDHDNIINLRELLLVKPAGQNHLDGWSLLLLQHKSKFVECSFSFNITANLADYKINSLI